MEVFSRAVSESEVAVHEPTCILQVPSELLNFKDISICYLEARRLEDQNFWNLVEDLEDNLGKNGLANQPYSRRPDQNRRLFNAFTGRHNIQLM